LKNSNSELEFEENSNLELEFEEIWNFLLEQAMPNGIGIREVFQSGGGLR